MTETYRIFDNATGEELFPSDDFHFPDHPAINQQLSDPQINSRYGGPAIIRRIDERAPNAPTDSRTRLYIEANNQAATGNASATASSPPSRDDNLGGGGIEGSGSTAGSEGGEVTGMLTEG